MMTKSIYLFLLSISKISSGLLISLPSFPLSKTTPILEQEPTRCPYFLHVSWPLAFATYLVILSFFLFSPVETFTNLFSFISDTPILSEKKSNFSNVSSSENLSNLDLFDFKNSAVVFEMGECGCSRAFSNKEE